MQDEIKPESGKKKKQISTKWGLIIIFAAAVILFGGAYTWGNYGSVDYFVTDYGANLSRNSNSNANSNANANANANANTNSATADWKTYTNDTYGFSFKYPSDWLVKDLTSANMTHIPGLLGFYGSNPITVGEDSFYIVKITSNTVIDEISSEKEVINNSNNQELISETNITKYSQDVTLIRIKNKTTNVTFSKYFVSKNNYSYILTGPIDEDTNTAQTANNILETFQFTN